MFLKHFNNNKKNPIFLLCSYPIRYNQRTKENEVAEQNNERERWSNMWMSAMRTFLFHKLLKVLMHKQWIN